MKTKKTTNLGLWITKELYEDLCILKNAYPDLSINELVNEILNKRIELIRSSNDLEKVRRYYRGFMAV